MPVFRSCNLSKLILCLGLFVVANSISANTILEQQRALYKDAQQALKNNQLTRYQTLQQDLIDYPLYPYLQIEYFKQRLNLLEPRELSDFFERYTDLPAAASLRSRWLRSLAKKKHWSVFLQHYRPQSDITLQCQYLLARIDQGLSAGLIEDIRQQWLSPESLPAECDPAFEILYNSHYMNDELVWQRLSLAMQKANLGMARYLAKKLSPALQSRAEDWFNMHQSPGRYLAKPSKTDQPIDREILLYGIKRLSNKQVSEAVRRWQSIQSQYLFSDQDKALVNRHIALNAVRQQHPHSRQLLSLVPMEYIDRRVFTARLQLALQQRDWQGLVNWLDAKPPEDEAIKHPWYYWKARALQQTGYDFEADRALLEIVNERDYYGFLAADHLQADYGFNHSPTPSLQSLRKELYKIPALARIKELLYFDQRSAAVREWQGLTTRLDADSLQQAALLASEWGWHDRVIVTLGQARLYDDLVLRFPLSHEKPLQWYSNKNRLDASWVFALVRAESAFVETAKSPAGALGLMQVMPATGKMVAKGLGWKQFSAKQLLKADKNIPIGSAYLQQMLQRFGGNMILATAAYNAGPYRVDQWLPEQGCVEPDIWIEQIPFTETRRYVKRILYYASIYDWRRQQTIKPMRKRMAAVHSAKPKGMAAAFSCRSDFVSLH